MDKILNIITKNKINLFLTISLSGIIIFLIWMIISGGSQPANWLVMEHNYKWQFSDFFRQIVYASDLPNIYFNTTDAPFPPLAYLLFNIIYLINPAKYNISLDNWSICEAYQYNLLIFVMIVIVNIILLFSIIQKYLKNNSSKKIIIFTFAILFSAPFMSGAIERGNPALLTLTLILFSLYFKDSENKFKRYLSLMFLAIAVGFKLYPVAFILLWIKEKRYKEVLAFIVYCIIFVLMPFAFTGGINGFFKYCSNILTNFSGNIMSKWTSIESIYHTVCARLNIMYFPKVAVVIKYIFLVINIIFLFVTKEKKKTLIPIATLMAVFTTTSHRYTAIYMLIPLIYFLIDTTERKNEIDNIYIILFGLIFTIPVWAFWFEVDFAIFIMIYIIDFIWIIENIWELKNHEIANKKIDKKYVKN